MNLSKSKYCNGVQCLKMLWLDKYKPEEKDDINNESVLENGTEVGEYAKKLFGNYTDIKFDENLNNMINLTKDALKKEKIIITEASFNYNNNFCSVDILKKDNNDYEIYEVKSSTKIKDIYIDDISYQYYVLNNLGFNLTKASIVYINNKYIRNNNLDINKLFNIEDVTKDVLSRQKKVENTIKEINNFINSKEEPKDYIDEHCNNPYPCPYFRYCTKHLNENNIFKIPELQFKTKIKYYKNNLYNYEDLLSTDIDDKYKQLIDFELNNKDDYININNIKQFMNTLSYPLYFLDFETFQQSIPMYDGIKPYEQIPFQYSLHYIENKNSELKHKEFLAEKNIDPRRSLAESLVKDIPKNVCTLAYNMKFEKMVIKNLANLYPDLKEHLMNIYDNIKDLMIPFKDKSYYSKEMHGSFSIKYVLPALFPNDPSLNYHNLEEVHNGTEAMASYKKLNELDKYEELKLRKNLLKYCELDTYAMVKIWQKLNEIINKKI